MFLQHCKIYLCGTKKDLVEGELKNRRKVDYHTVTDYAEGKFTPAPGAWVITKFISLAQVVLTKSYSAESWPKTPIILFRGLKHCSFQ